MPIGSSSTARDMYLELRSAWKRPTRTLARWSPAEVAKLKRRLQRDLDALARDRLLSVGSPRRGRSRLGRASASASTPCCHTDEPHETKRAAYHDSTRAKYRGAHLGDAAPALGRPGRERLVDPALHRPGGASSVGSPSRPSARRARSGSTSTAPPSAHVGDRVTSRPCWRASVSTATPALARLATIVHAARRRRRAGA